MSTPLTVLTVATALLAALSAGALFVFSSMVMPALARLAPADGLRAMQAINVAAINPVFLFALLAPAIASAALIVIGVLDLDAAYAGWLIAGGILYLALPIGLTSGYHVPRNNALAEVDPASPDAGRAWARYRTEWTRMNHLRAAGGLAAAGALIGSLLA